MDTIGLTLPRHLALEMDEVAGVWDLLTEIGNGAWEVALCLDQDGRIPGLFVFLDGPVSDRTAQVAALASVCEADRVLLLHSPDGGHPWEACEIAALRETLGVEVQSEEFTRRDKSS